MPGDAQSTENSLVETGDEVYARGRSDMMVEVLLRAKKAARFAGLGDSPQDALTRVMDTLDDLAREENLIGDDDDE